MAELTEPTVAQQARALWSLGDYASAMHVIAGVGPTVVEAAGVTGDDAVLDVACGNGNATIPAAKTGAMTTGLDITPELLEKGKEAAADAGVEIEWIEGDAQDLPFDDGSFDVVTSVFGCMFAPDQKRTAAEIARVLKTGGRIAVGAWTPEGNVGKFFMTVAKHMPPPPEGFQPPILWGNEQHVHGLFEGTGVALEIQRTSVEFKFDSIDELFAEMVRDLPPMVAAKRLLEADGRWEPLRDELLGLYEETNTADDGTFAAPQEYLLIKGTRTA